HPDRSHIRWRLQGLRSVSDVPKKCPDSGDCKREGCSPSRFCLRALQCVLSQRYSVRFLLVLRRSYRDHVVLLRKGLIGLFKLCKTGVYVCFNRTPCTRTCVFSTIKL